MTDKSWILNLGVGFGTDLFLNTGGKIYLPYFRFSFDKNVAMGDKKLPFFFGGLVGYTGWGRIDNSYNYFNHRIPLGFRAGYHFNWGVDKLDTYAAATAGWVVNIPTGAKNERSFIDIFEDLLFGVNIGARWFINDGFGFWAEAGYVGDLSLDVGISFKF